MQIKCTLCNSNKECQLLLSYNTELSLLRCLDCGLVFLFPESVIADTKEIYSHLEKYTLLPEIHFSIINKFKFKMASWRHCGIGRGPKPWVFLAKENLARAIEILIGKVTPFTLAVPLLQPLNSNQLDIGCGHGSWLLSMRNLGYENLYGIDIRETAASERLGKKAFRSYGDILEVDLPNGFFDVIRLEHVIEHLPNPKERLRKIADWLKPSGKIVMSFPNINSYTFKYFGKDTIALELPEHLYHFPKIYINISGTVRITSFGI